MIIQGQFIPENDDEDGGVLFYRCCLCRRATSKWELMEHKGCKKCGHARVSPSNLSLWEKCLQIFKSPKVWTWHTK